MVGTLIDLAVQIMHDPRLIAMILTGIGAGATVLTLAMPLMSGTNLDSRMKAVAVERSKIRQRERDRASKTETSRRQSPKTYMKQIVDSLDLGRWLGTSDAREKLQSAGYRSPSAMVTFLFFRLVAPIIVLVLAVFYIFVVLKPDYPLVVRLGICAAATFIGFKLPQLLLSNTTQKRQLSIRRGWPDALDLLLICVESGMSIEHAFRRVAGEVGTTSLALAEEMSLTTAELSYLPDRRTAYENLGKRTNLDGVKAVTTALIQSEKFGTPLGQALRVLAQENRDMRMMEAEKKAARLPPMLTVPMIVFFLPCLFVVIMGPAAINVMGWK
jgi:tight adherence protein C